MSSRPVAPDSAPGPLARPTRAGPVCEFARAHLDFLGTPPKESQTLGCSPEPLELRSHPVPPDGSERYVLCNGHLRDLYSLIDTTRNPARGPDRRVETR